MAFIRLMTLKKQRRKEESHGYNDGPWDQMCGNLARRELRNR